MKNFVIISGSLRDQSFTKSIAKNIEKMSNSKYSIEYLSIKNIPLFNEDVESIGVPSQVTELAGKIKNSNGMIIVTPEYNGSYSGVIKNTLDWLSRESVGLVLRSKPVLTISSSVGGFGGAIAHEDLNRLCTYLGMYIVPFPRIRVSNVQEIFNEEREILDDNILKQFSKGLEELLNLSNKVN